MKTRAQSWRERLSELRAMVRETGERLDAELLEGFQRQHDDKWWFDFNDAAERGDELSPVLWRSAMALAAGHLSRTSWLQRLVVRNRAALEHRLKFASAKADETGAMKNASKPETLAQLTDRLARKAGFDSAETQRNDRDDFREVAVWTLADIVREAFEAGRASK